MRAGCDGRLPSACGRGTDGLFLRQGRQCWARWALRCGARWFDAAAGAVLQVFPEPQWVRWDSYAELCAIGYETEVLVCRCQPHLQRIASLTVQGVTSALWHTRQLYLASTAGVDLAFVDSGAPAEEPYDSPGSADTPRGAPPPPLPPLLRVTPRRSSPQSGPLPRGCIPAQRRAMLMAATLWMAARS